MTSLAKGIMTAVAFSFVVVGCASNKAKPTPPDTRLIASILIYQCDGLLGLVMVPQEGPPQVHSSSEEIPLLFYKDSVVLSKNGVVKLTVPCAKKETTAKAY